MSEQNGLSADLYDLTLSAEAEPLLAAVKKHITENVEPITEEFFALGEGREDRWSWAPGQLELLEGAKNKAKESGLWNFFLPDADTGEGLKNLGELCSKISKPITCGRGAQADSGFQAPPWSAFVPRGAGRAA